MRKGFQPFIDFRGFIDSRIVKDPSSTIGMFVIDAQHDGDLPNARNWKELRYYFENFHFGQRPDVMASARKVWRQYRSRYPAYLQP